MGLKALIRGLGVGGRKVKVKVKERKKCQCEDGLIFFSRLIMSGKLKSWKLQGLFLPSKKKLP